MQFLMGLGNLALRVLLVGAMGAVAAWIVRRRGAEVRHAVWAVVLAGMLALPLLTATLPPLQILPAGALGIDSTEALPATGGATASGPARSAITGGPAVPAPPPHRGFNWPRWPALVITAYCIGLVVLLLRTGAAIRGATRMVSDATRVRDAGACALLEDAAAALGMGYPLPELRESVSVRVPFTAGWLEPVIVLPADWRAWDGFKLRSVLAHELAHVRRRDWGTSVAAAINRAVFWYHPLAWWLERRLAALAEEACDAATIRSTGDGPRYAGVVLEFATAASWRGMWAATSMARSSGVGSRVRRILEGRPVRGYAVTGGAWAVMLALALPAVYAAAAIQLEPDAPRQATVAPDSGLGKETYLSILGKGWQLTPEAAAQLESGLARDPHNVAARVRLISYYYQRMIAEPRARHVLWLIENHPEANVFRVAGAVTDMRFPGWAGLNTQAGYDRAKQLWLQQTERHPADTRILANAAAALSDPEIQLRLVRQARAVEPGNPEWTTWLASTYARAVRDVLFAHEPGTGSRSFTGAGRQRGSVWSGIQMPLPMAEHLMAELETSNDAALVEETGELLVEEMALLQRVGSETPEMAPSAAFGRSLLERARELDPANPRWQRQ